MDVISKGAPNPTGIIPDIYSKVKFIAGSPVPNSVLLAQNVPVYQNAGLWTEVFILGTIILCFT